MEFCAAAPNRRVWRQKLAPECERAERLVACCLRIANRSEHFGGATVRSIGDRLLLHGRRRINSRSSQFTVCSLKLAAYKHLTEAGPRLLT